MGNLSNLYTDSLDSEVTSQIRNKIDDLYAKLKQYENVRFDTAFDRILFYYELSSNKNMDMFIYKFKGPFVEHKDTDKESHITDGFLGSVMRMLPIIQKNYKYKSHNINRPKYLFIRDTHVCISTGIDASWIKSFIDSCPNNKIYFNNNLKP